LHAYGRGTPLLAILHRSARSRRPAHDPNPAIPAIILLDKFDTALIVGAGSGLSASLARLLAREGMKVSLAARSIDDLSGLAGEIGASTFVCDAARREDVEALLGRLD